MCGRFALAFDPAALARHFQLPRQDVEKLATGFRYNIAPSQSILAIRYNREEERNEVTLMKWWLVPHWARKPEVKYATFNARAEDVAHKPAFRHAFRQKQRCLIPCSGFYEWKQMGEYRQPYYIYCRNEPLFALAGLWDFWQGEEQSLTSCTILTIAANELVSEYHDKNRMPVILGPEQYREWLTSEGTAEELLQSFPAAKMAAHPVSRRLNRIGEEGAELIQAVDPENDEHNN